MSGHTRPAVVRLLVIAFIPLVFTVYPPAAPGASADSVVEIRASGRYFVEPANLSVTVDVVPDPSNRLLRFEADSDNVFRATEIALDGEHATRLHVVQFKGLPAGRYLLRAEVHSARSMRGSAEDQVLVVGKDSIK